MRLVLSIQCCRALLSIFAGPENGSITRALFSHGLSTCHFEGRWGARHRVPRRWHRRHVGYVSSHLTRRALHSLHPNLLFDRGVVVIVTVVGFGFGFGLELEESVVAGEFSPKYEDSTNRIWYLEGMTIKGELLTVPGASEGMIYPVCRDAIGVGSCRINF